MIPLFVLGLFLVVNIQPSEALVGVCYKAGPNQPPPTEVVALLEKHKINQIRLFEPDKEILEALKGKNIEVMLGVPNSAIIPLSTDPKGAEAFVRTNITNYVPDVKIKYLVVGTDVCSTNDNTGFSFFLYNTLQNFQKALSKEGLRDIKLTSAFDTAIFNDQKVFTSDKTFLTEDLIFLDPILKLISSNGGTFLVNIYPYYAHILNPKGLSLDTALGKGTNGSLFDDMVDAMYSALDKAGYSSLEVVVSETGWPSAGGVAASVEYQKIFITNLVEHVEKGTTERPNKPIETYLYAMFDEDVKGAPEIEKHFGLFTPKKELKFEFNGGFNSDTNSRSRACRVWGGQMYSTLLLLVLGLKFLF